MVVVTDDSDSKSTATPPSSNPPGSSSTSWTNPIWTQPPPSYIQSYTQPSDSSVRSPISPQMHNSPRTSSQVYLLPSPAQSRPKRSAAKRFCAAFGIAVLIYLLFASTVRVIVVGGSKDILGVPAGPKDSDANSASCKKPVESSSSYSGYTYKSSYSLPVSSKYLYFISRGSYAHGSLRFELSDKPGELVEVETLIHARSKSTFDHINVCSLANTDGSNGVGFFTPESITSRRVVEFETIVRFPREVDGKSLSVTALRTAMKNWAHDITDMKGLVEFNSVLFTTTNARITAASLLATSAILETTNGRIEGSFNVSDHLTLKTTNAAITTHANMWNRNDAQPTKLILRTTNGRIESSASLFSSASSSGGPPRFSIAADTSNGKLTFEVKDAVVSPFPKLDLITRTSNSRTDVTLHPTFEGTITQETSNSYTEFSASDDTQDPSGKSRHRWTSLSSISKNKLTASVWWGDDKRKSNSGSVLVRTTNARNTVTLV
ncbi:hypothetical protein M422DRAFT_26822 [Sphaerobolus stellatus SS14]|nr:hypothetical protein M422DRAFT_26822 [Sphaerobolus stellatus SS14]